MADQVTLLPSNAAPVELAISRANAARRPLSAHLVRDVFDPKTCPADLLGYLAWSLSVDVWRDEWPEELKRHVIGRAFLDQRLKGSLEGLERYERYEGARVLKVVAPPQRLILGRRRTGAELTALYARLPEVRIYAAAAPRAGLGAFHGRGFYGANRFLADHDAATMHAKRAELRRDGRIVPIKIADVAPSEVEDETDPFERLFIPRRVSAGRFWGALRKRPAWADQRTARFVVSLRRVRGALGRVAVAPGRYPMAADPERVYEPAPRPPLKAFMARRLRRFATPSTARLRVYDRLRLWDDAAAIVMPRRGSFWGASIRGATPHVAVASIEIVSRANARKRFWGLAQAGAFIPHDPEPLRRALGAARAAKSGHERILVDLNTAFARRLYWSV